jgi:CRP-like cAMP-binding protein
MTETPVVGLPLRPSPEEQTYPTLTAAQVARVASYGRVRSVAEGEVLIEAGSQLAPFFVVVSAPIAITIIGAEGTLIKVHQQGGFAGEVTMLTSVSRLHSSQRMRLSAVSE